MRISKIDLKMSILLLPFILPDLSFINETMDEIVNLMKIIWAIGIIMLVICNRRTINIISSLKELMFFLVFYCFTTLSNNNDNITVAFINSINIIMMVTIFCYESSIYGIHIFKVTRVLLEFLCLINLCTVILIPKGFVETINSDGYYYFFGYDNSFVWWGILLITFRLIEECYCEKKINYKSYLVIFFIIIFPMIIRNTATGIIVISLYILFVVFMKLNSRWNKYISTKLVWISILLSVGVVLFKLQYIFSWIITAVFKKSISLSGRYDIWEDSINKILEKPLFGHGAEVGTILTTSKWLSVNHCHNFILNTIYMTGLVGLLVFLLFLLKSIRIIKKTDDKIFKIFIIAISLMFVSLITESQQNMLQILMLIELPIIIFNNRNKFSSIKESSYE